MARTRPRLSADARGYGHAHRAARAAAIAAWQPGQPCVRCGRPITTLWMIDRRGRTVSAVDLDHEPGTGKTAYRGLAHRHCNRSTGATYGNQARGRTRATRAAARAAARRW